MKVSDMLNHNETNVRQRDRINTNSTDQSNLLSLVSSLQNINQTQEISLRTIEEIGTILHELKEPETFDLNSFLIQFIIKTTDPEMAAAALSILKNICSLPSFNSLSLANNDIFTYLILFLSGDFCIRSILEKEDLSNISVKIIETIFEKQTTRDFLSVEIYQQLFEYILSDSPGGHRIFVSIMLQPQTLYNELFPLIFNILSAYLSNPTYLSVGVVSVHSLLLNSIPVPQEIIIGYCSIFPQTIDESLISSLLYIMLYLDEPPLLFFDKIIEISQNFESESLSFLGIRLLVFFCMKWSEEQKQILVSFLLSSIPNMSFSLLEKSMFCLVNLMNPLPTDTSFFSQLIRIIEGHECSQLIISSAMQIIQIWSKSEMTSDQLHLINEFQTHLEDLSNSSISAQLRDICTLAMQAIESILS